MTDDKDSASISARAKPSKEMIEAGVWVLWTSGAVETHLGCDRLLIADIFEAMLNAEREQAAA